MLAVGAVDSPELFARVNPRMCRNYSLIRTILTRCSYSEHSPITAMVRKLYVRYMSTSVAVCCVSIYYRSLS